MRKGVKCSSLLNSNIIKASCGNKYVLGSDEKVLNRNGENKSKSYNEAIDVFLQI